MITKKSLTTQKRVAVYVVGETEKFRNGKQSAKILMYQANPDEVLKVVAKALEEQEQ